MEVDEALKGFLLSACKEPVDGAFLVGLQVVFEEAVAEVAAEGVTAGFVFSGRKVVGQKSEVVFQVGFIPGD